jgi:hypothetical protein
MPLLRIASVLLALTLPATSTAAKLVCLSDNSNQFFYQFSRLKVPKKADAATPVVGLAFSAVSANALPLSGTLIRDGNTGKLYLGFTRFFQECIVNAVLDDTLNGTISYDCNFDGANDGTFALSAVSCPS